MASAQQGSRPMSPHLSIYRFHFSMVLSIGHRIAGVAVTGALVLFVAWLWAAAYNEACFSEMNDLLRTGIGQALLVITSFVFYIKFGLGLRHLLWDTGRAFEIKNIDRTGWAAILFAVVATALTWAYVWGIV